MRGAAVMGSHLALARLARRALLWAGFGSGVALTAVLAFITPLTHGHGRVLMLVMLIVNIAMLTPWNWRTLPQSLCAFLAVLRGFHWVINLVFGLLGLLLLTHASSPRRALAYAALSLMFVLWAAAARRLTQSGASIASTRLASTSP